MNILSLYTSFPSSTSLFQNGQVVAATHEERFTRKKNDETFPIQAINYCLKQGGVQPSDLDAVAIASYLGASYDDSVMRKSQWTTDDYLKEQYCRWLPITRGEGSKSQSLLEIFPEKIDYDVLPSGILQQLSPLPDRNEQLQNGRVTMVADYLGISESKVRCIEHHRCHAAYSYYASPFRGEPVLALTIDGSGDGLNATIGSFDAKGLYTRHYETSECNIGRIYRYMTLLLGMKPNEHEYKVMGLAPYGKAQHARKALDLFRSTLYVDGTEFKWHEKPTDSYFWFKERLEGVRFDNIAFALQTWVEDLLAEWVRNAVVKFGIDKVVIAGGVAMNIKAMGKVASLPEVKALFIGGSASDESMAISAGICMAEDLTRESGAPWDSGSVSSLPNLYFGPEATREEEQAVVDRLDFSKYQVMDLPSAEQIALLLHQGKVIARCAGRMEFGQRSLGNRSILADPSDLRVKGKINEAIKSRDFWMPFAPVIMDKYIERYIINPKHIESPHMTIGFDTTSEGYDAMIAACHPADRTARPQILHKDANPELYHILEAFEQLTGRGALLNTSFNLHGHPIVNTPSEAFSVLEKSGLDGLILNRHLILKNS
ncbi:MAG: carbamoyl transferase [Geobacteraceae bacterium]|nr:carbamoyl transferase [Geobacteraceae bacterium]